MTEGAAANFHGGGFVTGNIAMCDAFSRALANRSGCTVVAVDYRKAPEHEFPVPVDDCYAATRWLRDDAARCAARLCESGVPVTHVVYDGMIHGFLWMAGAVERSKQALVEIGREIRAAL